MNFKNWLVNEMPIKSLTHIPPLDDPKQPWAKGAKKKHGWSDQDAGIVSNPGAIEKFKRLWANTEHDFDFYLIRHKTARKHVEVGEVDWTWLDRNFPDVPGLDGIFAQNNTIKVIFTNNTGAEKVPFTAWTAAHRFAHAIKREYYFEELAKELQRDMRELFEEVYRTKTKINQYGSLDRQSEKYLRLMAQKIGTMRSARQGNLRNYFEFAYEIFAQYLMTKDKIQFQLPVGKLVTHYVFGNPQGLYGGLGTDEQKEIKERLDDMADKYNEMIDSMLGACVNRIFVM